MPINKQARITRIGNSKGIILPMRVVKELSLQEGEVVELSYVSELQELRVRFPSTKQLSLTSGLHTT